MLDSLELKARMKVENLSTAELADKLRISRQYLHRVVVGKVESVSERLEARYDNLYSRRLIVTRTYRGAECPFCSPEIETEPKRIYPGNDLDDDLYECDVCKRRFTYREAMHLLAEKRAQRPDTH